MNFIDLQHVNAPIIPIDDCKALLGATTPLYWTNICTGPLSGGISACSGDSGGPVVQAVAGGFVQRGVVSWGFIPCGRAGNPTVHVSVGHYRDWIDGLKETHPEPPAYNF